MSIIEEYFENLDRLIEMNDLTEICKVDFNKKKEFFLKAVENDLKLTILNGIINDINESKDFKIIKIKFNEDGEIEESDDIINEDGI